MHRRFAFCYRMSGDAARIGATVPAHVAYWKETHPAQYLGGPFADRSGGLITFLAAELEEATRRANADPFVVESLVRDSWVREWLA
jgi:uncharacterized protein YciI